MCSRIRLVSTEDVDIPLKEIKIFLNLGGRAGQATMEQYYENTDKDVIEAYYLFPMPADSAVYDFEADINGKVIKTQLKAKEAAVTEYNQAISEGKQAVLMDQTAGNIFSVCLGNIPKSAKVMISIRAGLELLMEAGSKKMRWNWPTNVMPLYTPEDDSSFLGTVMKAVTNTSKRPYKMTITGSVIMPDGIVSIESKTHGIKFIGNTLEKFEIVPVNLNEDIILTIERNAPKTSLIGQVAENVPAEYKHAYQCNIVPDFSHIKPTNIKDMCYIIILDTSGSMQDGFENAVGAVELFLGSLPIGSTFNVIEFNSTFTKFSPEPVECTHITRGSACAWLSKLKAGGGTEVLDVMKDVYATLKEKQGAIIFVSDGGVSNTEQVIKTVKENKNVGLFTIGIGRNVSQQLIKEMASSSVGGVSEFVNNANDGLDEKVSQQLSRAQQSMVKCQKYNNVQVKTTGTCEMFPEVSYLYEGDCTTFHIFSSEPVESVTYNQNDENGLTVASFTVNPLMLSAPGNMFHRLAGVKLLSKLANAKPGSQITHLQEDPSKNAIIKASIGLGILSNYTAFIGVEVTNGPQGPITTPVLKKIPLQSPYGYGDEECAMEKCMAFSSKKSSSRGMRSFCTESFSGASSFAMPSAQIMSVNTCGSSLKNASYDLKSMPSSTRQSFNPFATMAQSAKEDEMDVDVPVTKPKPTIKLTVKMTDLPAYAKLGLRILTGQANGVLPFASQVSVGDYIELTDGEHSGVYKVTKLGSNDEPWVLQKF